jgi:hypothetical protein
VQESMAGYIPEVCNIGSKGKIVEQLQIDMNACLQRLEFIKNNQNQIAKVAQDLYRKRGLGPD